MTMKTHNPPLRIMHTLPRRKRKRSKALGRFGYRAKISPEQFRDARIYAGLTREQAADLVGVSLRTIGHWETGQARPSYAAFKLLRVLRHGDLVDPRWSGYSLVCGRLVTPENHTFEPADLAWWSLTVRMARAFSETRRRLAVAEALASARRLILAPPKALALGLVPSGTTQKGEGQNDPIAGVFQPSREVLRAAVGGGV